MSAISALRAPFGSSGHTLCLLGFCVHSCMISGLCMCLFCGPFEFSLGCAHALAFGCACPFSLWVTYALSLPWSCTHALAHAWSRLQSCSYSGLCVLMLTLSGWWTPAWSIWIMCALTHFVMHTFLRVTLWGMHPLSLSEACILSFSGSHSIIE